MSDEQVLFLGDIFPTGWQAAINCDIDRPIPLLCGGQAQSGSSASGAFASSIAAHGLLQLLVERKAKLGPSLPAGARLAALQLLAKEKRIDANHDVACILRSANGDYPRLALPRTSSGRRCIRQTSSRRSAASHSSFPARRT